RYKVVTSARDKTSGPNRWARADRSAQLAFHVDRATRIAAIFRRRAALELKAGLAEAHKKSRKQKKQRERGSRPRSSIRKLYHDKAAAAQTLGTDRPAAELRRTQR